MYADLLKGVGIDADILNPVPEIKVPDSEMKWAEEWFGKKCRFSLSVHSQ